jgi:hypothetical protein
MPATTADLATIPSRRTENLHPEHPFSDAGDRKDTGDDLTGVGSEAVA